MADGYPNEIPLISPDFKAVSMQHALATGFASLYSQAPEKIVKIDLSTDNAGKRAIDRMLGEAIKTIEQSAAGKKLLAKTSWNKAEREQWEMSIATITRDLIHDEPLFGAYRLDRKKTMTPISITEISPDSNFHCEPMAALTGIMLQKIENHFLEPSEDRTNMKRRTDYYLTGGNMYRSAFQSGQKPKDVKKAIEKDEILHGYVISPITANYVEGTTGRSNGWVGVAKSPYNKNDIKGYTFDDYLAGFPMISDGVGFTVGYDGSVAAQKLASERKAAIAQGDYAVLESKRMTPELTQFPWQIFADERNLLKALGVCKIEEEGSIRGIDSIKAIEQSFPERLKGSGRNYLELACDSEKIDFAVTENELTRAVIGNRIVVWGSHRPFAERLVNEGIHKVSGKQEWTEQQLVEYLHQKGVDDVWVQRVIPKSSPQSGNNFEATVKDYYEAMPAKMLTIKTEKGEEKIPFHAYLTLCRDEYVARGGKLDSINAAGVVVPVIFSPARRYAILKELNGRTNDEYESEEFSAVAYTSAIIVNNLGTKDFIKIQGIGVLNGIGATNSEDLNVAIPESTGEVPPPAPTPAAVKPKQHASRLRP
jgi:hypothetical protein